MMLTTSLLLTMTTLAPADVAGVAAPIYCPEFDTEFELLLPAFQSNVPTNTSLWIRQHPNGPAAELPKLTRVATMEAVDLERIDIPLSIGTLIQLRPRAPLLPNEDYQVDRPNPSIPDPIVIHTLDGEDRERPDTPVLNTTVPNSAMCSDGGISFRIERMAGAEPFLILAENGGATLAVSNDNFQVIVPAAAGEEVEARLVVMDMAGNRSVASAPILEENSAGGCACARPRHSGAVSLAIACAFLISLGVRVRNGRRRT